MKNIKLGSNKSFGIVFFVVFLLIAIYPTFNDDGFRLWSLTLSLLFLILGLLNSKILTPLNKLWFKFGLFLGKLVSPIVLALIFFLVITPIGYILKLFKKDVLSLSFNNNKSYWLEKKGPKSKMKNQF